MLSLFLGKAVATHEISLPAGLRCPKGALCRVTSSWGPVINKEKPLPINTAARSTPRPSNDSHLIARQLCARDFMWAITMAQGREVLSLPQWTEEEMKAWGSSGTCLVPHSWKGTMLAGDTQLPTWASTLQGHLPNLDTQPWQQPRRWV